MGIQPFSVDTYPKTIRLEFVRVLDDELNDRIGVMALDDANPLVVVAALDLRSMHEWLQRHAYTWVPLSNARWTRA